MTLAPVIAIDGPSASGKGTVAEKVSESLGFHFLDSGALYRLVGLAALERAVELDAADAVAAIARDLRCRFTAGRIELDGRDVTDAIRAEQISTAASRVAAIQPVRDALLERQRAFRELPGLVADGRDMGTVVFPDATLKIYLTADAAERARRRHKQLIEKGMSASIDSLLEEIRARDRRDSERASAPLVKAPDAVELDTTGLTIEATVGQVLALFKQRTTQAP